jgi:hypothetical protein
MIYKLFKNKKMKKELLIPVVWFSLISVIAILLTSCATGHTNCDAYGQNNTHQKDVLKNDKS